MNKKAGIIIGIIAIVILAVALTGINKNTKVQKVQNKNVQQTRTKEEIKTRNEALRYLSEAHYKAKDGDYNGAIEACKKAEQIAPNEPPVMNCQRRIDRMFNRTNR